MGGGGGVSGLAVLCSLAQVHCCNLSISTHCVFVHTHYPYICSPVAYNMCMCVWSSGVWVSLVLLY